MVEIVDIVQHPNMSTNPTPEVDPIMDELNDETIFFTTTGSDYGECEL